MLKKQFIILLSFGLLLGCATSKDIKVQDEPPKFFGRVLQNTLSRYNSFYNSNYIYSSSLIAGENGYNEDYASTILPVSVQDAVAKGDAMSGEMDEVIQKTATDIDKRPYSKWVDDNYLLNGIAHYVKGDYEKALDIFLYTSSEYRNGINYERVGARQKVKEVNYYKERKQQAEERLKEIEQQRKENEKQAKENTKERKENAKKHKSREKRKLVTREQQAAARKKAKAEGREVTTAEILQEIRESQRKADVAKKKITKQDIEQISNSPILVNDNADNPGFLAHPLAAKDAMLWLAKTYITREKFIAANAVLTAINEDPTFPNRLNVDYYLTYADMYIRLDNNDKAIEYVQLAIQDAKNKQKGRLYYVLGQLYEQNGDAENAKIAYETVEKYHPEYNMIYYAKMRNYKAALTRGEFNTTDYTAELRKMANDVKNDEFYSEVYYYLGEAYLAQEETEKGIQALNASIEENPIAPFSHDKAHLTLANHYYDNNEYALAQENFSAAVDKIKDNQVAKNAAELKASSLQKIVKSQATIRLQDSLLQLGALPQNELADFLEKKAKAEIKNRLRSKLQEANSSFGADNSSFSNQTRTRNRNQNSSTGTFYFYDLNIASTGFSEFKRVWGNRQLTDDWRRSNSQKQRTTLNVKNAGKKADDTEALSKDDLVTKYLSEIPVTTTEKEKVNAVAQQEYLAIANVFIKELGEYQKGEDILKEFVDTRYPTQPQMQEVQELLILCYKMKGEDDYIKSLQQSKEGRKAVEQTAQKRKKEVAGVERLYELTYQAYANGQYEKALKYTSESLNFANNPYEDKFAFIKAVSLGKLQNDKALVKNLSSFMKAYPKSSLKDKADQMIEQYLK